MALHKITLAGYRASYNGILMLGTSESYGCETLLIDPGTGWEDLGITCIFNVDGVSIAAVADSGGLVVVPPEATATETKTGAIVFRGVKDGVTRISADLSFRVLGHSFSEGTASAATPSEYEQWLAEVSKARDEAVEAAKAAEDSAGLIHELSVKGEQLAYDEQAYATYDADANMLTFGIPQGVPGAYYTPSIASDGTLSWGKSQEDIPDVTSSSVLSEAISKAATATDNADTAAAGANASAAKADTAAAGADAAAASANTAATNATDAATTAETAAEGANTAAEAANALSGRLDELEEKLGGLLAGGSDGDYLVATEENPYGIWAQLYTFAVWDDTKAALAFFSRHMARMPEVGEYIEGVNGYESYKVSKIFTGWDTADYGSASVVPWKELLIHGEITTVEFCDVVHPKSCSMWFSFYLESGSANNKLARVIGIENLDTSNVTDMSYMFYGCSKLTELNVIAFDTSKVTDMSYMFYGCSSMSLTDPSVLLFDTSKVTDMSYMFYGCSSMSDLNVSYFDTSSVTDMSYMFYGCSKLEALDVSSWDTSSVRSMTGVFYGCSSLTKIDVYSSFDTSSVTDMQSMFYKCSNLTELDVSSWDTSSVTKTRSMFYGCSELVTIYAKENTDWATEATQLTTSTSMFSGCSSLVGAGGAYSSKKTDISMANTQDGYFTAKAD